ncbi:MAG: DUF4838 domain-containing protein [Ferruginibacter sp.]
MKKFILKVITIFFLVIIQSVQAQQFTLVKRGNPKSRIIIPEKATVVEIQAAKVLQDYIERISGAAIPIEADNTPQQEGEILIGNVNRPELKEVPKEKLGKDGLFIKNNDKSLVITGGTGKGILYGVYTFLEKYMGCRKYSSAVTYVPKKKTIVLSSINDMELPAFAYRETFYRDAVDPEYQLWHKLDSHVGPGKSEWGYWVHTFDLLLSPKEYGESHPEYFSYYDGKRHAGTVPSWDGAGVQPEAQLCLSNPGVLEIVCKNLQAAINKNPEAIYWSVSQNDNVNYCRCPDCSASDKKYAAFAPEDKMYSTHGGSKYPALGMGSILTFVNRVAERFPDKIISTLAYQYSRVPPKDILPRKNVNIMLCSIESARNTTIEIGDTSFSNDLKGWGQLTNNIIIWDYVIRFSNLFAPFPNLRILQPNLTLMRNNRVSAVFEQGNREIGGEFADLRAYMIDKLLWNPDINIEEVMNDFLTGYYGKASKQIREYINLLHDNNMEQSGYKLSIFGNPAMEKESFLSDSLITVYNNLFDQAEKAVSGSPEILERVKTARLPVYYSMLEIAKVEKTGKRGAFIVAGNDDKIPNPAIVKILYDFVYQCIRTNVTRVTEWRTTPLEYLAEYKKFLE